jgi:hypothetical protein
MKKYQLKTIKFNSLVLIYMLAYNLIRSLIWAAKQPYRIDIERISFKGTLQHL